MTLLASGRPVPATGLPTIPELDDRVFAVHYSTQLAAACPASTPRVSALVVRQVVTCFEVPFAEFKVAERRRLPAKAVRAGRGDVEAELLAGFFDFVAGH